MASSISRVFGLVARRELAVGKFSSRNVHESDQIRDFLVTRRELADAIFFKFFRAKLRKFPHELPAIRIASGEDARICVVFSPFGRKRAEKFKKNRLLKHLREFAPSHFENP